MSKWDQRYLDLARFWADQCSKDPSTKVGAVLVGMDPRNIALGYNGFPKGIEDSEERLNDRSTKYKLTMHAERNVLDNAKFETRGAALYCTMFICSECAKSAIQKGVVRVVCPPPFTRAPWNHDAEWTRLLLLEAGVELEVVSIPDP